MKKLICLLVAFAAVAALAACSKDPSAGPDNTTAPVQTHAPVTYAWPDNALFKDVPAIKDTVNFYKDSKNDQGYTYTFFADDISYGEFCEYIEKLENAGFEFYDTTGLHITTTDDVLPDELPEDTYNASWLGKRRGFYVAAQWYGDEYYQVNELPEDSNVRLVFYTYDAFKN